MVVFVLCFVFCVFFFVCVCVCVRVWFFLCVCEMKRTERQHSHYSMQHSHRRQQDTTCKLSVSTVCFSSLDCIPVSVLVSWNFGGVVLVRFWLCACMVEEAKFIIVVHTSTHRREQDMDLEFGLIIS